MRCIETYPVALSNPRNGGLIETWDVLKRYIAITVFKCIND